MATAAAANTIGTSWPITVRPCCRHRARPPMSSPAADHFARHIRTGFDKLKRLIKRHEQSVVWGS